MTKEELFATIQRAGMTPVPITQEGDDGETLNYFEGGLNSFLVSAKAIGATAVFVQDLKLEDWLFFYNPAEDEDEPGEGDPEDDINLAEVSPALAEYKKYLGQNISFDLTAKGGVDDLWLTVSQDWMADFDKEVERAQGQAMLARRPKSKR